MERYFLHIRLYHGHLRDIEGAYCLNLAEACEQALEKIRSLIAAKVVKDIGPSDTRGVEITDEQHTPLFFLPFTNAARMLEMQPQMHVVTEKASPWAGAPARGASSRQVDARLKADRGAKTRRNLGAKPHDDLAEKRNLARHPLRRGKFDRGKSESLSI